MISNDDLIRYAGEVSGFLNPVNPEIRKLGSRGSDRVFFRVRWDQHGSVIVAHYNPERIENVYYAEIGRFLRDIGVAVPQIFHHDPDRCLVVMEDLGSEDLWSIREVSWEYRKIFYRKTLNHIHVLHSFPEKKFPSDSVRRMEDFSPSLYLWERDYFRNHFIRDVCMIRLESLFEEELEAELSRLADRLLAGPRSLVHRDLQSQNVMIHDEKTVLIDFQGMRLGSPFYDLGSLLCDPYTNFSEEERIELLDFYYNITPLNYDPATFRIRFWEASVQRLMQALGAYGFLGLKKGLSSFLEHIPAGIRNLDLAVSHVDSLPRLKKLCEMCRHIVSS